MNDIDLKESEQEYIAHLQKTVEDSYAQVREMAQIIKNQDAIIRRLKDRLAANNIHIIEKSFVEMSREEIERIDASIPAQRFLKADNEEKTKMPNVKETVELYSQTAENNFAEAIGNMLRLVTDGVELEKHGIDPKTLMFKPGYGPNGKIEEPKVEVELTFWQKVKKFFSRQ